MMKNKHGNVSGGRPKFRLAAVQALMLLFWSSCAVEPEFSGTADILTTFRLTSPAAMEGKITITEAYLKLNRLETVGILPGDNNTSATLSIAAEEPPYRLSNADSAHATISISPRVFVQLDLDLYPFTDSYELVYTAVSGESPAPVQEPQHEQEEETDPDEGNEPQAPATNAPNDNHDDDGSGHNGTEGDGAGAEQGDDDGGSYDNDSNDGGDESKDEDEPEEDEGDSEDDDEPKHDHKPKHDDKKKDPKPKHGDKKKKDKKKKDTDRDKHDHHDHDDRHHKPGNKGHDRGDNDDRDDWESRTDVNNAVDLDHFFQNARPGLVVFGTYENNGTTIKLIFVMTDVERLSIRARQSDSFSIILTENNTAQLNFDPAHWFESVTPADIEGGAIQTYQQQNVLFIHPGHNAPLYQALISKIEGSADLQVTQAGSEGL